MIVVERWVENLRCPNCGKTGTARLSQADGWTVHVDKLPEDQLLHEPHNVRRRNFMQVTRLASEPELREAVGKPPTMIDSPLTQSTLIAKIVFVFQLEGIVRRFASSRSIPTWDSIIFSLRSNVEKRRAFQSGAPLQGWRHRLC